MVVADTSPLNYLVLIEHINLLPQLYGRVLIPESVLKELERDAISLALTVHADAVLLDERRGRQEAETRGLKPIGTLGVLVAAHKRGLIDLSATINTLRQTSFHASPKLLASIVDHALFPTNRG